MDSLKSIAVIATGLASYLIPTYLFHKKNMSDTTIIETTLDFDKVGVKDMIVNTNNSNNNEYILRRDTIKVHNIDDDYILAKRFRIPETHTKTSHNNLKLNGKDLEFSTDFSIAGFYDTNSITETVFKKRLDMCVEALRKRDKYIVAINKKTKKVVCVGESDRPLMFYWMLRRRSGYFKELWYLEAFLLGCALFIYLKKGD